MLPDTFYWPHVFGQRFGILACELRYFADCVAAGRRPERITPEESRARWPCWPPRWNLRAAGKLFIFGPWLVRRHFNVA